MGTRADEVRSDIDQTRADLGETLGAIGERVSPRRAVRRRRARLAHGLHVVRDSVMGTAGSVTREIDESAASVRERLAELGSGRSGKDVAGSVATQTRGNPLAAGMIAFASGALLASALPASAPEQSAAERLGERARPIAGAAKEVVAESGAVMKESVKEAVDNLKDASGESVSALGDEVRSGADTLRDAASEHGA